MQNQETTKNAINVLKYCAELCTDIDSIFEDIKKGLEGKAKSNKNPSNFFTNKKDGWLDWECYFEKNGLIKIVLMLAVKGNNELGDDSAYQEMMRHLDADSKIPLLCFYGVFKPVELSKAKYQDWWITYLRSSDTEQEWLGFDINAIGFDKEICIKTQDWNKEHKSDWGDYSEWFLEAKIKIRPILSIQGRKDVVDIAEELNQMTI